MKQLLAVLAFIAVFAIVCAPFAYYDAGVRMGQFQAVGAIYYGLFAAISGALGWFLGLLAYRAVSK